MALSLEFGMEVRGFKDWTVGEDWRGGDVGNRWRKVKGRGEVSSEGRRRMMAGDRRGEIGCSQWTGIGLQGLLTYTASVNRFPFLIHTKQHDTHSHTPQPCVGCEMTFECMKSERIKRRHSHYERPRRNQHIFTLCTCLEFRCVLVLTYIYMWFVLPLLCMP